tara:strand:- start:82 stop:522 length:441 start_codon:yes stop_codon:yes gene_type:complete
MSYYRVSFYLCPVYIPVHVFKHPWIVIEKDGQQTRYEIIHYGKGINDDTYLCVDLFDKEKIGVKTWAYSKKNWKGECIHEEKGKENSLAHKIHDFIESESKHYPYLYNYRFYPGPNNNTYVQWVIDHFPELKLTLPWSCIGKDYKK